MDFKNFIEDAKSKILGEDAKGKSRRGGFVDGVSNVLGAGQEMASDAAGKLVDDFNQMLPVLSSVGYDLKQLEIELGVPPKIISHFTFAAKRAVEPLVALEQLTHNALGYNVLKALLYAERHKHKFEVAGMSFDHIELEAGLIPSVKLCYVPCAKQEDHHDAFVNK